jgi:lipoprotein NlpI
MEQGMTGSKWLAFASAAMSLVVSSAVAQTMPEAKCTALGDIPKDERIAGCTTLLESNRYGLKAGITSHFFRARAFFDKGDFDNAIADYTEIIRLNPNNSIAYVGRGLSHHRKLELDLAIADYDHAIQISPSYRYAFLGRANTYRAKGELDRAMVDYDHAIDLDSKDARSYRNRGIAYFEFGATSKALADFDQSIALDPKDAYTALWRDLADRRGERPSRLSDAVAQLDMNKWPAPVIRLFLGQTTAGEVLVAADDANVWTKKSQTCEANFYIGELALRRSEKDEAVRLFGLVVADCPKTFFEYLTANAELRALTARP